jgi:AcrR family transcriptional regulator
VTHSDQAHADRRVQRTRKLLQDAFIEMTIRKGFAAVTVRDITEHAGVNRATFYHHYQDKFDLLDQYAQEVYQLLETPDEPPTSTLADRESANTDSARLPAGMVRLFEHIRTHAVFYRVMLGKNGDPGFGGKIQRYIEKRLRQSLPHALLGQPLTELYLNYVSSGSVGVVLWWLEHEDTYSPATMAAVAMRLSAADRRAVLE